MAVGGEGVPSLGLTITAVIVSAEAWIGCSSGPDE